MKVDQEYEKYKAMSKPDIQRAIASMSGGISEVEIARLALEDKQMEERTKYEKERIELQHKNNIELTNKQLRWIKFSAILNAIAIIVGVLLGWFLSESKSSQTLLQKTQQTIQSQNVSPTLESHSLHKNDKTP